MKILYDARTIRRGCTGVGVYTHNLLHHLLRIDFENQYVCLFLRGEVPREFQGSSSCECIEVDVDYEQHPRGEIWENLHLPRLVRNQGCSILHGPAFLVPWVKKKARTVVTIHDLIVYRMPENYRFAYRQYLKMALRQAARVADRIIVVSHCTGRDVQEILGVKEERINVVHLGAPPQFRIIENAVREEKRTAYQLPARFALCVGTLEPRKNHLTLLKAFEIAKQRYDLPHSLVLVGGMARGGKAVLKAIQRSPFASDIMVRPHTPAEDLIYFYNCADLFVFPSLYEGFGLVLLEAMACGAPVIAGREGSVPEVVGDAAVLVDPRNAEELAQAMADILMNEEQQQLWRQKGLRQVANFSWTRTARDTLEVYRALA